MTNLLTYAFIIGAVQGFLLVALLLKKKENKIANRLLAITMFFFGIDLVLESLAVTEQIKNYPSLIGLMQSFPYLYGPAIYLYIYFITRGIKEFHFKYLFHYTPFILVQLYALVFFYFEPASYQLNWVYLTESMPWHLQLVNYLTPIYGGLYIALSVYEAYKFNKELKSEFSSIDKHNLSWVNFLMIGAVLLWLTAATMTIIQINIEENIKPELVNYLAISLFVYAMAYKGLRQPEVIIIRKMSEKSQKESSYKKSGLGEVEANAQVKDLLKLMDDEKPFKNEKLSLDDLSKMTNISKHNLSEIINTKIEMNFYDFINSYRVDEVKKLIKEDSKLTYSILAHGFEAGFSSKSAFYIAFKKFTNQTPAQYRKNI